MPGLGVCAGRGSCVAAQSPPFSSCACTPPSSASSPAYGGVGCQVAMTAVDTVSALPNEIVAPYGWRYYSLISPGSGTFLQVNLLRHSGDPMQSYNPNAYAMLHAGVKVIHANLKTEAGQGTLRRALPSCAWCGALPSHTPRWCHH